MRQVEIPGGTAQFRDRREELKVRQLRLLGHAGTPASPVIDKVKRDREKWEIDGGDVRLSTLTRQDREVLAEWQDAEIIALLHSWTLDQPLPSIDTIQDLGVDLYARLVEVTMELQNTTDVFGVENFDPNPAEDSPTVPSSDSDESAREERESPSEQSESDGKNTATDSSSKVSRTKSS
jgi:hypothetical protein